MLILRLGGRRFTYSLCHTVCLLYSPPLKLKYTKAMASLDFLFLLAFSVSEMALFPLRAMSHWNRFSGWMSLECGG